MLECLTLPLLTTRSPVQVRPTTRAITVIPPNSSVMAAPETPTHSRYLQEYSHRHALCHKYSRICIKMLLFGLLRVRCAYDHRPSPSMCWLPVWPSLSCHAIDASRSSGKTSQNHALGEETRFMVIVLTRMTEAARLLHVCRMALG